MACTLAALVFAAGSVAEAQSAHAPAEKPVRQTQSNQPRNRPPQLKPIATGGQLGDLAFSSSTDTSKESTLREAPKHFLLDQKAIWTSPANIRLPEASWLVPLAGLTAGFIATDPDASLHLNSSRTRLHRYDQFSNYGVGAMAAGAGGLYLLGAATHDEHQRETGYLAFEAAVDSLVPVEAIKYATRRERPLDDNAAGKFWHGGDSFPSEHAAVAWSIAGVVAHEYPSPIVKALSYGAAGAISASRVLGKQHFPSDALVGSAIGWLVGEYVYRAHHDPFLPGGAWSTPAIRPERPGQWEAKFMGSPYVPLDSWIYPAILRLAALGYINSDFEGLRPWTRMECARLVEEAGEQIADQASASSEAQSLYHSLEVEFSAEIDLLGGGNNREARIESVYTRVMHISGQPLTDGYHFGQTITNDFGRPYQEGFNNVTGFSGWATDGPFFGYIRGEYQYAPSAPALPLSARQAINQEDGLPPSFVPSGAPTAAVSRFRLLDSYVGMNVANWQITFGRQSLWWGPDQAGPMMFSDNANPITMFRINRVSPFKLPSILGLLGPIRGEVFLGQLDGQQIDFGVSTGFLGGFGQLLDPQPFIHGEKISFKPTRNLEIGLSTTGILAGQGVPFTPHTLEQSFFSTGNGAPGSPEDPGDRRGGFDFSYRIPGARKWLTLYADGFTDDEVNPLAGAWDKAAWLGGLYFSRLPGLPKLDLRVEGLYSDPPIGGTASHGFFYTNDRYKSGYTADEHLIGSWIGRQGQGAAASTNYWFTPKDRLQFNFRHQKVSQQFVPFGGTITDGGVRTDFWVRSMLSVSAAVQYEAWNFPVIASGRQNNVSTSIEVSFWPQLHVAHSVTSAEASGFAGENNK